MQIIFKSFLWGVFSAGLALMMQILTIIFFAPNDLSFGDPLKTSLLFLTVFVALEEISKYLIVSKKIFRSFFSAKKILLHSLFAGIGFSLFESFFLIQKKISNNSRLLDYDLFEIIFLHILTFILIGQGLLLFRNKTIFFKLTMILLPTFFLHLIYNIIVLYHYHLVINSFLAPKMTIFFLLALLSVSYYHLNRRRLLIKKLAQE